MPILLRNGHSFRVEREVLDVTTMTVPDFSWDFTDAAGHRHKWFGADGHPASGRYSPSTRYTVPTLVSKMGETYYCMDCRDEHADTWLECAQCGERIDPGYRSNEERHFIAGLASYYIDEQLVTKEEFDRRLSEEK